MGTMANDDQHSAARGRPRSKTVDAAILAATIDLIAQFGLTGWTLQDVAAGSRTSKPAIYRRWLSKHDLVLAAIRGLAVNEPVAPTGNLRDDLIALIQSFDGPSAALHLRLATRVRASPGDDEALLRGLVEQHLSARAAAIRGVLDNAQRRGDLLPTTDVDAVIGLIAIAVFAREQAIASGLPDITTVVDLILNGIAAESR